MFSAIGTFRKKFEDIKIFVSQQTTYQTLVCLLNENKIIMIRYSFQKLENIKFDHF
jgi:hypothetical protein